MSGLLAAISAMNGELVAIAMAVTAALVAMGAAVHALVAPPRSEVLERIDRVVGVPVAEGGRAASGGKKGPGLWSRLSRPFVSLARPSRADELSRLRLQLFQAGLRSDRAMETFLASKLVMAAGATVVFLQVNGRLPRGLVFPMEAAAAFVVCAAAFFLPNLWISSRIKDRQGQIERGLPDAMDLLVTCVEAGLGLDAALARVADELKLATPLLAAELNTTCLEVQAGVARREAFRRLSERTGVEDLRQLSAVLAQTEVFGTSIARALRVHADGMRVHRMQDAERRAAMVGVKMTFPLVLCILPSLMAIVLGPAMVAIFTKLVAKH
jgi:tight adherence protein C